MTTNQQNWREEYDRRFTGKIIHDDTIKDFISSTIQSEVDKAVKERENDLVEKINEYGTQMQGRNPLPTVQQAVIQGVLTIISSPTRATMGDKK